MRKTMIALPKTQRLLPKAYGVFKSAGYSSAELEAVMGQKSQKQLEFATDCGNAVFLLVKNTDIPQYVDRNWAELGLTAFDCYREYELKSQMGNGAMRGDNFISTLLPDLKLVRQARFCVAGRPENLHIFIKSLESHEKILTVATTYPGIAGNYFNSRGVLADIVTISGSSELMPSHADVDVIFDIVETGSALRENGLIVYEEAMEIQTKILVSKAAYKYDAKIAEIVKELSFAIKQG